MKKTIMLSLVWFASSAFAGSYIDTLTNNSFETATNLNPYFSNGYSPDIGDANGANTSLLAPWVTVSGMGNDQNGGFDYYRFTTQGTGPLILDIDYAFGTPYYGQRYPFDSALGMYSSARKLMIYNDDERLISAGAGGSITGWDSFIEMGALPAGSYYVKVGRYSDSLPDGFGNIYEGERYTLQVQSWQIAAVPEPASYAMLLAGMALLGGLSRRRKSRVAPTFGPTPAP